MGEFEPLIEKLSDDMLNNLVFDDMGVLNLRGVVDLLRLVRGELETADSLEPDEITTNLRNEILGGNFGSQIDGLISQMGQYGPTVPDPQQQRTNFRGTAEALRNTAIERIRPILRTDQAEVQRALAELNVGIAKVNETQADLAKQQTALATTSAGEAAADLSGYYKTEADSHGTTASRFLWATGVAVVVLVVLTVSLLFAHPPDYSVKDNSADQWIQVSRNAVARLAVLSIAGFAVAFCARNYRVNKHLQVLNKRRENALKTFGLMQAGVVSDEARNVVVVELVRAVFTSEETGYLGAETERTIIESPGGAGMLVSAMARGSSGT